MKKYFIDVLLKDDSTNYSIIGYDRFIKKTELKHSLEDFAKSKNFSIDKGVLKNLQGKTIGWYESRTEII